MIEFDLISFVEPVRFAPRLFYYVQVVLWLSYEIVYFICLFHLLASFCDIFLNECGGGHGPDTIVCLKTVVGVHGPDTIVCLKTVVGVMALVPFTYVLHTYVLELWLGLLPWYHCMS